jgi:hypothetical protein
MILTALTIAAMLAIGTNVTSAQWPDRGDDREPVGAVYTMTNDTATTPSWRSAAAPAVIWRLPEHFRPGASAPGRAWETRAVSG